jgi:hypothetical protein
MLRSQCHPLGYFAPVDIEADAVVKTVVNQPFAAQGDPHLTGVRGRALRSGFPGKFGLGSALADGSARRPLASKRIAEGDLLLPSRQPAVNRWPQVRRQQRRAQVVEIRRTSVSAR